MVKSKIYVISFIAMCLLVGCGNGGDENIDNIENVVQEEQAVNADQDVNTEKDVVADQDVNTEQNVNEEQEEKQDVNQDVNNETDNRATESAPEDDIETFPSYDPSWTEEEMIAAINKRSEYYRASAYYSEINDYWENSRGVRDISYLLEPLFETDRKYYTKEEFEDEPMLVIHLAKNEIYARHGYIFQNKDLYNYFIGCLWYSPTCSSKDFDDSVFNEYEKANLKILDELDTY